MLSEVRLKKKNRTIKRGPKKLNFGASKPGVGGAGPLGPPSGSASVFSMNYILTKFVLNGIGMKKKKSGKLLAFGAAIFNIGSMIISLSMNITMNRLGGASVIAIFTTRRSHGYVNTTTWLGISQFFLFLAPNFNILTTENRSRCNRDLN